VWISAGALAVAGAVAFAVVQSPLLDVDEVEVIGVRRTGADQVLQAAGVEPGTALLGLDLSGPRRSIAALPWVDQVRSTRAWSGRITFDITEREAIAQIPVEDRWASVDLQGRVLQIDPAPGQLPVVLFAPVPEPGKWLARSALPLLEVSEAIIPLVGDGIGSVYRLNGRVMVDLPGKGQVDWGGLDDSEGKAVALAAFLAEAGASCFEEGDLGVPEFPVLTRKDDCP